MKNKKATTKSASPSRSAKGAKKAASKASGLRIDQADLQRLQDHLREAQETLEAIRNGDVDAVVVSGSHGSQVYSLSGAEQPYRVYVEQMQEGAVTVAADGLILYSNQRFAEMTGVPLERVISSQIAQYIPFTAWQDLEQVFQLDHGGVKHECQLHHVDGGFRPVNLSASRLPMEDQHIMCLVVTDLSSQKEREELRLGKEGAEKANLAKDAFLAALSHELRTPLTPALMATMALEQDASLPESARATLGMIRRNVELEARLIDDLLDLTRIVQGKLELHVKEVDLHTTIHRALEICQSDIETKRQNVEITLDAERYEVVADPVRLQQALWNVIRNAVKFTPTEGMITIRTSNLNAKSIRVEITDTGVGFTPEVEATMFKPFEQGGREITRRFGGLGLGLAISHSILESHQGSIRGESAGVNQGACFTLEMPLGSDARKKAASSPATKDKRKEEPQLRILLAEDHDDTRSSMTHLLRRAGHEVKGASSASLALELAAQEPFDLVISDLGLPDMSGLELMQQLHENYGLRGIAVSGYGMEEDIQRSYAAGFVHHLTKPIHMERLRQVIEGMADNRI